MKKETLQKAKTLENDINIIGKILAESEQKHWIKIITPRDVEWFHSTRFQEELVQWLRDKKQEYEQEFEKL